MNFMFPAIKTTRTVEEQQRKIEDEITEYKEALSVSESDADQEAVDILHAAETFIRVRFKGREDVLRRLVEQTTEKNRKRGYYTEDCF